MTHHMPAGMAMDWARGMRHCCLIRDPAQVIASYLKKMPAVSAAAIGIVRQRELFDELERVSGQPPLVLDSNDVLRDPGAMLTKLCAQLDVPFFPAMLQWPPGERASDGVWASHWYQSVQASSGFAPWQEKEPALTGQAQALAQSMRGHYEALARYRIAP
jgi:hypothetical protein